MNSDRLNRRGFLFALLIAIPFVFVGCSKTPKSGTIVVETLPENGAIVNFDGEPTGQTPLTIENVEPGEHYLVFTKSGYKRETRMVSVQAGENVELTVEMENKMGNITIETTPPGASVYLDDTYAGLTPLKNIKVASGEHSYQIELKDHKDFQNSVNIEADNFYTFTHALKAIQGTLQVFSRPTGAQIFINETEKKETTPATFPLKSGAYTIGLYLKGYMPKEETIQISPNTTHSLEFVLEEGNMPLGMVFVPEGDFIFGIDNGPPDERPQKKISLEGFYIDKFEVTNSEFKEVFPDHFFQVQDADLPVTGVTWYQATEYARAVNKRLPTEKEWEKASRGTKGNLYPWGNTFNSENANVNAGPDARLAKVGQFKNGVSIYGSMDMSGNAMEWTSDWYKVYDGNDDVNIDYGNIYKVLRGGSYLTDAFDSRSPKRHFAKPDAANADYGFRCAMDAN
jgi:formylglycine-generating enzyme required for sulfatase activity